MSAPTVDGKQARRDLQMMRARLYVAIEMSVAAGVTAAANSAAASTLFKDQSGKTRKSIRGRVNGMRGRVVARGAMFFLVNGTRGHGPSHAKMLRFVVNGQAVYAKWVKGITPRPIMSDAAQAGAAAMHLAAQHYVGEAIAHANG
jgi:hypothetical protein